MRKFFPVLGVLSAAVVAAVLRALQLTTLFEPVNGLITPFRPLTIVLVLFCLLTALTVILFYMRQKPSERAETESLGKAWFVLDSIACACLFLSGLFLLGRGLSHQSAALIVNACLTFATAAALALFAYAAYQGRLTRTVHGLCVTLSVFWGCYTLIMDYWGRAGDPTLQSFLYGMLALLFGSLALLSVGAYFYGGLRPKRAAIFASLGLFFSFMTLGGALIAVFIKDPAAFKGIVDPYGAAVTAPSFLDILGSSKLISTTQSIILTSSSSYPEVLLPRAATLWTDNLLRLAFFVLHSAALLAAFRTDAFTRIAGQLPAAAENHNGETRQTDDEALTERGENDII